MSSTLYCTVWLHWWNTAADSEHLWYTWACPQEELATVGALLAMLDSPVAALRAKALVAFALLGQNYPALLLEAFQAKLSHQVRYISDAASMSEWEQNVFVPRQDNEILCT